MRYSVHDGPGIRTTVFFKGCPLSCKWCHNPEGIENKPQQSFNPKKCMTTCSATFITSDQTDSTCNKNSQVNDQTKSNYNASGQIGSTCNVFNQTGFCYTGARETIGYEITAADLMKEIKKDLLFYEQSGGGVTFSGGEPFNQAEFLLEMLTQCKNEYIKTAVDTSGYCDPETILKAAEITDYFLYDIKFMDSKKHENYCGVSNDLILNNLKKLSHTKVKLLIRIPVIPSINDSLQEMVDIYDFIKDMPNIETVHLLPYHNLQSEKYNRLGKQYELSGIPDKNPDMDTIVKVFIGNFRTKVGG